MIRLAQLRTMEKNKTDIYFNILKKSVVKYDIRSDFYSFCFSVRMHYGGGCLGICVDLSVRLWTYVIVLVRVKAVKKTSSMCRGTTSPQLLLL